MKIWPGIREVLSDIVDIVPSILNPQNCVEKDRKLSESRMQCRVDRTEMEGKWQQANKHLAEISGQGEDTAVDEGDEESEDDSEDPEKASLAVTVGHDFQEELCQGHG